MPENLSLTPISPLFGFKWENRHSETALNPSKALNTLAALAPPQGPPLAFNCPKCPESSVDRARLTEEAPPVESKQEQVVTPWEVRGV